MEHRIVLLIGVLFLSGCGGRYAGMPAQAHMPGNVKSGSGAWPSLENVKAGETIAIYLRNGRRFEHLLRGPDAASDLDMNGIKQEHVAAISRVPRDRLLDGLLTGIAAGTGVGMGYGYALSEGDFSGSVAAAGAIYGIAGGAGVGALLDAGFATQEDPLYVRPASGLAPSRSKRWNLPVSPPDLAGWIAGRSVELMLKDGTWIKARVKGGDPGALVLDVRDSSEKSRKGKSMTVRPEDVGAVTFRENTGGNRVSASVGGALAGFFTATLLAGAIDYDAADEKPLIIGSGLGLLFGTAAGLGLAEHYNWREVTLSVR